MVNLTLKDRLIISNQYKILEKLYPEESDYYAKHRTAIECGYKSHYDWLFYHIDREEMTEIECSKVIDILNMYRALTFSYEALEDKSGIDKNHLKFIGFDANEETKQYSYTQYFVTELRRFKELTYGNDYRDFNSHCPMLEIYERMLQRWSSYEEKKSLSKENICEIIKAQQWM